MSVFDKDELTLECPSCSHQFKQALGRLKNDPTLHCPACGQSITIKAQGLRDGLKQADSALADFERTLKDLNKRL